jgi:hypothetical protein
MPAVVGAVMFPSEGNNKEKGEIPQLKFIRENFGLSRRRV